MAGFELIHADCLTVDWGKVDAIITDVPYGTTACKWDVIIPFDEMWKRVKAALKPRGAFVTTASQPFTSALVMSNPKWFRYEWIWEKSLATGYLNANKNPMKAHENIICFAIGLHTYNPQKTEGKPYVTTRGDVGGVIRDKTVGGYVTKNNGERYPRSVIKINSQKETVHPTQKPVALYEYLIKTYTNEGDTVLDFCMGSGTTGVACMNTGRNFIGIEKDAEYFRIAQERIRQANEVLDLRDNR